MNTQMFFFFIIIKKSPPTFKFQLFPSVIHLLLPDDRLSGYLSRAVDTCLLLEKPSHTHSVPASPTQNGTSTHSSSGTRARSVLIQNYQRHFCTTFRALLCFCPADFFRNHKTAGWFVRRARCKQDMCMSGVPSGAGVRGHRRPHPPPGCTHSHWIVIG